MAAGLLALGMGLGGLGEMMGGLFGADAAEEAAAMQLQAVRESIAARERMADQMLEESRRVEAAAREDIRPWRESSLEMLQKYLMPALRRGPGPWERSPQYAVRVQEGERAIGDLMSRSGDYFSGQHLRELNKLSQQLAAQDYGTQQDEYYRRLAALSGAAGMQPAAMGAQIAQRGGAQRGDILSQLSAGRSADIRSMGDIAGRQALAEGQFWGSLGGGLLGAGGAALTGYGLAGLAGLAGGRGRTPAVDDSGWDVQEFEVTPGGETIMSPAG